MFAASSLSTGDRHCTSFGGSSRMRAQLRSLGILVGAIATAIMLGWATPLPAMVKLLATTALIMGGTEHPLLRPDGELGEDEAWVREYLSSVEDNYLEPTAADRGDPAGNDYRLVAVYTPEEFFPTYGSKTFDQSVQEGAENLDGCMDSSCVMQDMSPDGTGEADGSWVIVGYSQSSRIASIEKQRLIDDARASGDWPDDVSFVLISNPNRPNGGVLMRFHGLTIPFLGITMDGASPTDSCVDGTCHLPTVDIAQQYDALGGDFPIYPLNLLATANSIAAYLMLHGNMPYVPVGDPATDLRYQGQYGDTEYYLVGADIVPLLQPLQQLGVPRPLLLALDEPLRVLIETAYRRDISPGAPTPAQLLPIVNPVSLVLNLLASVPVGLDDAIEEATGERPFGTTPSGMFGVGGEDTDLEGLPPGFIPLGRPDPTTSTEDPDATPGIPGADTAAAEPIAAPNADPPAEISEADPETVITSRTKPEELKPAVVTPEKPKPDWRARIIPRNVRDQQEDQATPERRKPSLKRVIDRVTQRIGKPARTGDQAQSPGQSSAPNPGNDGGAPAKNDKPDKDAA